MAHQFITRKQFIESLPHSTGTLERRNPHVIAVSTMAGVVDESLIVFMDSSFLEVIDRIPEMEIFLDFIYGFLDRN
jgi:hypothetical protein